MEINNQDTGLPEVKYPQFDALSFEDGMKTLEQIVNKLDRGDISLEDSIELFQQGVYLSKLCSQKLESIEQKIKILTPTEEEMDFK